MFRQLGVACVAASLPAVLLADFSYEQTTKMTGGAMMGMMRMVGAFSKQALEPIQGTVSVKGNKMVHSSKDRAEVIDLDSETFTGIDFAKKTYSVMTFAEMAQMIERSMRANLTHTARRCTLDDTQCAVFPSLHRSRSGDPTCWFGGWPPPG